jgi:hypothetical protein
MTPRLLAAIGLVLAAMIVGQLLLDPQAAIVVLSLSIIALCAVFTYKRPLGGSGAFVFGYTLYFAGRPMYIALTRKSESVSDLFFSAFPFPILLDAQCLLALGLIAFVLGTYAIKGASRRFYARRLQRQLPVNTMPIKLHSLFILMAVSVAALLGLLYLSKIGAGGLYRSDLGAYAYQLPLLLHGTVLIGMVLGLQCWLRTRDPVVLVAFLMLAGIFLAFTVMMRNLTIFRTFYMSGFLAGGFACLFLLRPRITMKWLIIPVAVGLPFFQYLGQQRGVKNAVLLEEWEEFRQEMSLVQSYTRFFAASGDMNMFDTFVAANNYTPSFRSYAWSWLYVPLHLVPRFMWKGKPERGMTTDTAFTKGAPYSPGIPGFLLLDGGRVWMVFGMFVLGMALMALDLYLYSLPKSALSGVLIGVATVYGLYFPRFLLWQYFYGMLFFMVPGVIVWFVLARRRVGRKRVPINAQNMMPRASPTT